MKTVKITLISLAFALGCVIPATAQDEVEVSVGTDLVSSYVWRGTVGAGASFQPSLGVAYKGFSLGAWASKGIADPSKEVDFTLGYTINDYVSLSVTDYWWSGEGSFDYFNYKGVEDTQDFGSHYFEANVTGSYKGFSLAANLMFAGADKEFDNNGKWKQSYSTYFELGYAFDVKDVNLALAVGATPSAFYQYGYHKDEPGFNVVNVSATASKEIKITDSFSLPLFGSVIVNPESEDIHFVVGLSF